MKIYVDELPKSCRNCPCMNNDSFGGYDCNLYYEINKEILGCGDFRENEKHKDCPLQSLAEHDKQVRKEVCDEIMKKLYDCGRTYLEDEPYIEICIVKGILDQIQGETK